MTLPSSRCARPTRSRASRSRGEPAASLCGQGGGSDRKRSRNPIALPRRAAEARRANPLHRRAQHRRKGCARARRDLAQGLQPGDRHRRRDGREAGAEADADAALRPRLPPHRPHAELRRRHAGEEGIRRARLRGARRGGGDRDPGAGREIRRRLPPQARRRGGERRRNPGELPRRARPPWRRAALHRPAHHGGAARAERPDDLGPGLQPGRRDRGPGDRGEAVPRRRRSRRRR